MRKGFAPILIVIAILVVIGAIGTGGYLVVNKFISPSQSPKDSESKSSPKPTPVQKNPSNNQDSGNYNYQEKNSTSSTQTSPTPNLSPLPTPLDTGPTTYTQPQGKYEIKLPSGWSYNSTNATSTYSTTKFTGPIGYVAITFGIGKDPVGGCSEKSAVELFDRSISGCYLLQKDGSQILTRAYTKDATGIDFTIEAYINPPLSTNKPAVLDVIKSVNIE